MTGRFARKPARESRVEMTEIVLPEDTNQYGHAWGGRVMTLIDKAAAIAATRHCRMNVVTASVDSLVFRAPVRLGHILKLRLGERGVSQLDGGRREGPVRGSALGASGPLLQRLRHHGRPRCHRAAHSRAGSSARVAGGSPAPARSVAAAP